jgi:hypothetical protein
MKQRYRVQCSEHKDTIKEFEQLHNRNCEMWNYFIFRPAHFSLYFSLSLNDPHVGYSQHPFQPLSGQMKCIRILVS